LQAAAAIVLAVHLLWILWVIFGAFWTRGHPFLTAFHLASLVWGIIVELAPLDCPLTLVEQFFEAEAGVNPYSGGFLVHCLDRVVYPDVSESLLVYIGVAVCVVNLLIYARRLWLAIHRTARS
jgi:hypothetical protein